MSLVVARGRDGAIGRGSDIPWNEPEDLAHFRRLTVGHVVIFGSATWASLGRPLPQRQLLVLTSRPFAPIDGVRSATTVDEIRRDALRIDANPVVGGGAATYRQFMPWVDRAWVTDVDVDTPDATAYFEPNALDGFTEVASWRGSSPRLRFAVWDRSTDSAAADLAAGG